MRREQPGAIIVDQLRDRIVAGVFLRSWRPGEKLPSIRDVALAERVDRKTAAAAYRRLEEEGLVSVRARSGVYLKPEDGPRLMGPLERLHMRWLRNTYEGGRDLGLDTATMLRLLSAIADVEATPVPVVDADAAFAELIAAELQARGGFRAAACKPARAEEISRGAGFVVTTPFHARSVAVEGVHVVETTLAADLLDALRQTLLRGRALIIVPTEPLAAKLRRAFARGQLPAPGTQATVIAWQDGMDLSEQTTGVAAAMIWPGAALGAALQLAQIPCERPRHLLSEDCLRRVRLAALDAAMHRPNRAAGPAHALMSAGGDGNRRIIAGEINPRAARPRQSV